MITTKNGDGGTSEYFGKKVSKGGKLLEAIGTLDELQAVLGLGGLEKIQEDIYKIMGNLGEEIRNGILETRIKEIEKEIEKIEKEIKIPKNFVIFKNKKAMELNWVRTIVRRAERAVVKLETRNKKLDKNVLIYLNRLSDFIYLLALREEM
ncbi:MAG TPA: ATP:cob(I)alamin adenosyltransferase [Candidatus Woesebacteria bacterium]|nr:ATP:cob(I)alamin adenosyltransferase [Candidatus Woesebacteria bacterium]HPR99476.1 ATP:cob(I)alamin adenosyltransferase [Candidatus Woesebacteria bacterium]